MSTYHRARSRGSLSSSRVCGSKWFNLKKKYRKLSETEKKNLTKDIEAVREKRMKVCRANPKAAQHDVNAAFSNMEHEVS